MTSNTTSRGAIKAFAKSAAKNSLLQGLAFDVAAALAIVIYTTFDSTNGWGDFEWAAIGFLLVKTAVITAASYLLRTVFQKGLPSTDTALGLATAQTPPGVRAVLEKADPLDDGSAAPYYDPNARG